MSCGPMRGETALHFAAAYGDEEMVQALLASGGDKTIPDGSALIAGNIHFKGTLGYGDVISLTATGMR